MRTSQNQTQVKARQVLQNDTIKAGMMLAEWGEDWDIDYVETNAEIERELIQTGHLDSSAGVRLTPSFDSLHTTYMDFRSSRNR